MREIPLTKGYVALVDDEDYEDVSRFKWYAVVKGHGVYAARHDETNPQGAALYLHRYLTDAEPLQPIDHRDRNTLNCARRNLRKTTRSGNSANTQKIRVPASSQYKGVYWHAKNSKWATQIKRDGKVTYLGTYMSEEDAARAYDVAANDFFGDFACLNFPQDVAA